MGKLTWKYYGLLLLAGLAGFACSQQAQEPIEVGTVQAELQSDLVLPGQSESPSTLPVEANPNRTGQSTSPELSPRHIVLSSLGNGSQDRSYRAVERYEFLPALLKQSQTREKSIQDNSTYSSSWTLADKHWVRAGKGFGVGTGGMASTRTVHLDDASYYFPTVVSRPHSEMSEHLQPATEPFKSLKPLVFHHGATGFADEPSNDATPSGHSSVFEIPQALSPIPETRVYLSSKPKTRVTLTPSKNCLDLMNGNENLNQDRFYKLR